MKRLVARGMLSLTCLGALLTTPGIANAQADAQAVRTVIADSDSIYVDGNTFSVIAGKAKGDISNAIKGLGARELGPAAIIFRSGNRLFIVDTPLLLRSVQNGAHQNIFGVTEAARPNRVSIDYQEPTKSELRDVYELLRDHRALETVQQVLSPFRLPVDVALKARQCDMANAWYTRENNVPTITICYEMLKAISQNLPKERTPAGITPQQAMVGQFVWLAMHEAGHAVFDVYGLSIFGNEEDAADNFAAYIMLQFGKERARALIGGGAWAWRPYVADYRTNPVLQAQLATFASDHGQPQERFYNLMCMAYGADPVTFADLTEAGYLPPNRSPKCRHEYQRFRRSFQREIMPHIDLQLAQQVLDTQWLPNLLPSQSSLLQR